MWQRILSSSPSTPQHATVCRALAYVNIFLIALFVVFAGPAFGLCYRQHAAQLGTCAIGGPLASQVALTGYQWVAAVVSLSGLTLGAHLLLPLLALRDAVRILAGRPPGTRFVPISVMFLFLSAATYSLALLSH